MAAPDFSANPRVAPTTVTGTRGPENVSERRVIVDMADEIAYYAPTQTPFTVLTRRSGKSRTSTQYRFDWMEQDEYPRQLTAASAQDADDTSVSLAAGQGAYVQLNSVLINKRTSETILVAAAPTGDSLGTIVRGIGSVAQDIQIGDEFYLSGEIFSDGSGKGVFKSVVETVLFNYTEIVKTSFGITGRQQNTSLYGGKDWPQLKKVKGIEHAKSLEYRYFFGTRAVRTDTSTGHLQTFTNGIKAHLQSNVWDCAGQRPTDSQFNDFLEDALRWGPSGYQSGTGLATKWFFHSARWNTIINEWGVDKVRLVPEDKIFGLKVNSYLSPHGKVMLVHTPILDYADKDKAFLLDMNLITVVNHQGRGTKLIQDIEQPDFDTVEAQYMTDSGVELKLEGAHALVVGAA